MFKKSPDGTLIIDIYGDQPLTLQLNLSIDELMTKKQITLIVKNESKITVAEYPQ